MFKGLGISKVTLVLLVIAVWIFSVVVVAKYLGRLPQAIVKETKNVQTKTIIEEESAVISVVDKVSPSVVTVSAQTPKRKVLQLNPFGGFSSGEQGGDPQDIGRKSTKRVKLQNFSFGS